MEEIVAKLIELSEWKVYSAEDLKELQRELKALALKIQGA